MSVSSISRSLLYRGLCARVPSYRIPFTANHRLLRQQWAHEYRVWQADSQQVVFSYESRFNLRDLDDRICVRRYSGGSCLPDCVIERHNGLTLGIMVWGAISYHGRSSFLRIECNFNSKRYVQEVIKPKVVTVLQRIPGAIFQQDNARSYVAKTVRDFCSDQHTQFLSWPAHSPDMSRIEQVGE
ncbi:transposable element Tcb2 transposase [Trichonephila clavipes]|nr:transposable element Tcb2 transposase [Trichonephila clavipes]